MKSRSSKWLWLILPVLLVLVWLCWPHGLALPRPGVAKLQGSTVATLQHSNAPTLHALAQRASTAPVNAPLR